MPRQRGGFFSPVIRSCAAFMAGLFLLVSCTSSSQRTGSEEKSSLEPGTRPLTNTGDDSRPIVVALGDSLTAGYGVDPADSYPGRIQKKLDAEGYYYRVINAGVSGDTTAQGLGRLGTIRTAQPSIVILALGANDGLRGLPLKSTRQNLDQIIVKLKSDGARVVLAGMLVPPNYGLQYSQEFREIFPALAKEHRLPLVPFLLQGVAADSRLNQLDGIHPTAEGYAIVAENVWPLLKPLLRKSR